MPTPPLEFVVVERFPSTYRAQQWTGHHDLLPLSIHLTIGTWADPPEAGDWIIWEPVSRSVRLVKDANLRAMYQLPSGEPIP